MQMQTHQQTNVRHSLEQVNWINGNIKTKTIDKKKLFDIYWRSIDASNSAPYDKQTLFECRHHRMRDDAIRFTLTTQIDIVIWRWGVTSYIANFDSADRCFDASGTEIKCSEIYHLFTNRTCAFNRCRKIPNRHWWKFRRNIVLCTVHDRLDSAAFDERKVISESGDITNRYWFFDVKARRLASHFISTFPVIKHSAPNDCDKMTNESFRLTINSLVASRSLSLSPIYPMW